MTLLGIVAFAVALLLSVVLHEGGHFVTARAFGMKATQFFVGFGPTLWSRRRGETEYGVKAIPAGGFVKIIGMTPLEPVEPEDEPRAFYRQGGVQKAVVLAAGSFVHFVIAVVLVLVTSLALPTLDADAPVVTAPVATLPATITSDGSVSSATVAAPAQGVLQEGDRVLSVGGQPTRTWKQVVEDIRRSPGQPLAVVVQRNGRQVPLTITPVAVTRPGLDDRGTTEQVGAVGVGQATVTRHLGPVAALENSGSTLKLMVTGTYTAVTQKLGSITSLYTPHRDKEGLVGLVGAARVSGEVLAVPDEPFALKVSGLLLLIAGLNLFVGVFNLLPLLPLDGGHLAVLVYENARDKVRRLRGYRGDFQRVDFTKLMPLTYAVVFLFAGLTLWIMGADIVNPIKLTQ